MPRRRLRPPGIRTRTTIVAVIVVGVSVSLSMAALVLTVRSRLTDQITSNTEARAQDIAVLAKTGRVPDPIPGRGEDLLAQVIDDTGTVVAASGSIEGQAPLVDVALAPGRARTYTVDRLNESNDEGDVPGEAGAGAGEPFLIAAFGVRSPSGPVTVVVASSLSPVRQVVDVLLPRLALALPAIMLVVALTTWALTGRALRPVEAIRSEAEEISAASLGRRVPEPGTSDEVGRLAATMNRMLDRLEASAAAQRRFVSDASHELKSPIASIRTMLDVARLRAPGDLEAFLDDLAAEDARLEHLVSDLLVLARFDERSAPGQTADLDIDDIFMREATSALQPDTTRIDASGVRPARISGDPGAIESLARNLLENAVRHAASTVWIAVGETGREAVVTISDDGPGIALQDRERVFGRFVRLDESRTGDEGGTGLGLSVCRAVARSMGGEVRAVEPLHGGATFEVRLPLPPQGGARGIPSDSSR